MIVYSTGLDANPETLVARAKHELLLKGDSIWKSGDDSAWGEYATTVVNVDQMYGDVFARTNDDGERSPYPFHEVVADLVELGFDVRDWTGSNVRAIMPFDPDNKERVEVVFQSRIGPGKATVAIPGIQVREFVTDMERSGLWMMVSCRTLVSTETGVTA